MNSTTIDYDTWHDTYKPTGHYAMLSEIPEDVDVERIWSVVDGEGISAPIYNGIWRINNLEYIVTEKPWTEEVTVNN